MASSMGNSMEVAPAPESYALMGPSGIPLEGLELALARIKLTDDHVNYHGNQIGKIVWELSENVKTRDAPRMQKMEEDIVDLKDSVKSIVEWMEVISGKLDDLPRGPSVSNNEAGEVLDDPVNGKMRFVTVTLDKKEHTCYLARSQYDDLVICGVPRETVRKFLRMLHPMRELHTYRLSDDSSPPPESDKEEDLPEGARKKIIPYLALPALTYEYLKAATFQLYPPSEALMNIELELARYRDSQEKDLRNNIGKVLQYFRRYYLTNGTKIKAKSAEPRQRGIKRKAGNPTVTPARKVTTPANRTLAFNNENDGYNSENEFVTSPQK